MRNKQGTQGAQISRRRAWQIRPFFSFDNSLTRGSPDSPLLAHRRRLPRFSSLRHPPRGGLNRSCAKSRFPDGRQPPRRCRCGQRGRAAGRVRREAAPRSQQQRTWGAAVRAGVQPADLRGPEAGGEQPAQSLSVGEGLGPQVGRHGRRNKPQQQLYAGTGGRPRNAPTPATASRAQDVLINARGKSHGFIVVGQAAVADVDAAAAELRSRFALRTWEGPMGKRAMHPSHAGTKMS